MRTAHTLASILFLGAAATQLAACDGGDDATRLPFASTSATQRAAIVPAALDLTGTQAANLVTLAEIDHAASEGGIDGATCPSRAVEGDAVVYTADGCRGAASGIRWSGRLEAVNSRRTDRLGAAVDATRPEELRFVGLHADRDGAPLALDGLLRLAYGKDGRLAHVRNELTRDSVRLAVDATCSRDGATLTCKTDPGSEGELLSVGRFEVIATLRLAQDHTTGTLVLRGEDDLRVDTDARDAQDCLPYTVGGQPAGSVCLADLRTDDASQVDGVSWQCADDSITLTGFAEGSPIFTKVELRKGTTQQEIALTPTSHDDATQIDRFDSAASPASCTDLGGLRFVAVYADGSTDCYATGDWSEFDALACF